MPFPRKRKALRFTEEERHKLESISRSRTEEKRRTLRASILLESLSGQSDEAIARQHRVSRGTVLLCIGKCLEFGLDAALPGRGNRGACWTMRLLGYRIVLARNPKSWDTPTSCGRTSC